MPYGMCLRQIVLNNELWGYLIKNFEIDIISPIDIEKGIVQSKNIINLNEAFFSLRILRKLSSRSVSYLRASKMMRFFLDNDLGENLALRWRWFEDYIKQSIFLYGLTNLRYIGSGLQNLLMFCSYLFPIKFLSGSSYKAIILTHASDLDCTLFGIGANKLKIPLITITLGLDNYRHGPLIYRPDLMLLWGNEQEKEFKDYHLKHDRDLEATQYKKVGSLIHDTYLETLKSGDTNYLQDKFSIAPKDKYILVATMLEFNLPNQTALCDLIINFLEIHNLEHKVIVRKLPNADDSIWQSYKKLQPDRVYIQEPASASFDKRSNNLKFDIKTSMADIEEFVQTLSGADLVIGHYPSTLLVDSKLFDKPCCVPMFDWKGQTVGGHPQEKFYLSKILTHEHNRHYGLLYSKEEFYEFLYKILVEGNTDDQSELLFEEITGPSYKGVSGKIAVEAIHEYLSNSN